MTVAYFKHDFDDKLPIKVEDKLWESESVQGAFDAVERAAIRASVRANTMGLNINAASLLAESLNCQLTEKNYFFEHFIFNLTLICAPYRHIKFNGRLTLADRLRKKRELFLKRKNYNQRLFFNMAFMARKLCRKGLLKLQVMYRLK